MIKCFNCGIETDNPKYCSLRCCNRISQIGKKQSEETIEKRNLSRSKYYKEHPFKHTLETKDKIRKGKTGKKQSEETRIKISISLKKFYKTHSVILSDETKDKIRKKLTGKKQSEETIEKRVNKLRSKKRPKFSQLWCYNISKGKTGKKQTDIAILKRSISLSKVWIENDHISDPEKALANALFDENIPFTQQYPIRGIPDFFIEPNILVFMDGDYYHASKEHFEESGRSLTKREVDRRKADYFITKELENKGYIILRFWEHDIMNRIEWCINKIKDVITPLIEVCN
jgi:DNA mismatch endonuclease (patch repair protein)